MLLNTLTVERNETVQCSFDWGKESSESQVVVRACRVN